MNSFKPLLNLFLLLLFLGCSQSSKGNLSGEKIAQPIDTALLSNLSQLKKLENKTITFNADFDKIDFNVQPPDELRSYRLTHYFVRLVQPTSDKLFILVPTSNTRINSINSKDRVSLEGVINNKSDNICLFVTEIKKNPFTRK